MQACAALRFDPGHQLCIAVVEHVCKRVTKEEAQVNTCTQHACCSKFHDLQRPGQVKATAGSALGRFVRAASKYPALSPGPCCCRQPGCFSIPWQA